MFDKKVFEGIIAPMVNPCFEDDTLDMEGVRINLERLLASDVAGLYINGGTGDAANLTQQERLDIAAYLVPELLKAGKTANLIIIDDMVHIQKVILQGDLAVDNGEVLI